MQQAVTQTTWDHPLIRAARPQDEDTKAEVGALDAGGLEGAIKDVTHAAVGDGRTPSATTSFTGDTSDMNCHVYQTFNENDDKRQFGKTTEALGRLINMHTRNSGDLMVLHTDLEDPAIEKLKPISDEDKDNPMEQLLWKESMKDYITCRQSLIDNLCAIYSVVWGECSPTMKAKLMSVNDYETKSRACVCVWLLQQIKGVMYKFEGQ
jgi:hypothetical protein